MARHTGNTTTDHDTIRRWAEERGAQPACVKGTGRKGGVGMIRLDFPGYSGAESLQPITWDEWFRSFDDNDLALVYQDRTASGPKSNFNKLVGRETAKARARGDNHASRHHGARKKTTGRSRTRSTSRAKASSGRSHTARSTGTKSRSRSTGTTARKSGTRSTTRSGTTRSRSTGASSRSGTRRSSTASSRSGSRSRTSTGSRSRSTSRRSSARSR